MEEVPFPPSPMHSRTDSILLLLVAVFVPGEALLIEGYNYLWALMIGLLGEHEIGLFGVFPARKTRQTRRLNLNPCTMLLERSLGKLIIH